MKIYAAICLDIDRDAPFPIEGISHGVCLPMHNQKSSNWRNPMNFTLKATFLGLGKLISLFNENSYPFNCFIEASIIKNIAGFYPSILESLNEKNCDIGIHGLYHEDLSGELTNVPISIEEEDYIHDCAIKLFKETFNSYPIGFRAPYLKLSANTHKLLSKKNFLYDSSVIKSMNNVPNISYNELYEIPILRYETSASPFISYFWTLFERSRTEKEFCSIYDEILNNTFALDGKSNQGLSFILTLNLHPWHIAYSVKEKRYLKEKEILSNINSLMKILKYSVQTKNVTFVKISTLLK